MFGLEGCPNLNESYKKNINNKNKLNIILFLTYTAW